MAKLSKADIVEMIECYEYYLDCSAPMTHHDVAFVFNCSVSTVRKVLTGIHPLSEGYKAPVKNKQGNRKGRPLSSHCFRGHPLSGDNLYEYVDNQGNLSRRCRICQQIRIAKWRESQ